MQEIKNGGQYRRQTSKYSCKFTKFLQRTLPVSQNMYNIVPPISIVAPNKCIMIIIMLMIITIAIIILLITA